jgi:multisubunit Na+/H+ antiporter MnhB subunit
VSPEHLLDLALVTAVVITAFRALYSHDLLTNVVLYIAFGLLLAIVWVRLGAPDLALAEAAIGAGITGAMLLDAARQMGHAEEGRGRGSVVATVAGVVTVGAFGGVLIYAFMWLARSGTSGLTELVAGQLAGSGVDHPVTAVLLNFRGYDTWLEVGVLLVTAVGILVVRRTGRFPTPRDAPSPTPVALGAAQLIVPFGVLVGGYLLWRGTHAPGGAFQAGAVLGALGVLLTLLGRLPLARMRPLSLRLLLVCGFSLFAVIGVIGFAITGSYLSYPPSMAGLAILAIEIGVTISIAATLVLLFAGGRDGPAQGEDLAG